MSDTTEFTQKAFTRTRRRDGYEIAEVDAFVTEVTQALNRRDKTIGELQGDLTALRLRAGEEQPAARDDRHEASVAAVRLLEIATANADRLAAESTAEAERVLAQARAEADALLAGAHAEAERLAVELERRSEQQAAELDQHRAAVLAELSGRRAALEAQVENLLRLEKDHREHLRRYFTDQLARLEASEQTALRAVSD